MAEYELDAAEKTLAGMSAVDIADWRLRKFSQFEPLSRNPPDNPPQAQN